MTLSVTLAAARESDTAGLIGVNLTNDNWASAADLGTITAGDAVGSNIAATVQGSEPIPSAASANYRTVWWKWTPQLSGTATISTRGSTDTTGAVLDTMLAVWTGTSLAALTEVASNDDGPVDYTSEVTFTATAGTTYYIQVGGSYDYQGTIRLRWFMVADPLAGFNTSDADEWEWRFTTRAGGLRGALLSTDTASASPLKACRGQDTANDLGTIEWVLPVEHAANDLFDEDVLAHLYVRGRYVASFVVRAPQVNPLDHQGRGSEQATWQGQHLLSVWAEGCMQPAGGIGSQPASPDVIYDASHPDRDNSDFTAANPICTVDVAQTDYSLLPYGSGFANPTLVYVLGPAGTDLTTANEAGPREFYLDWDFAGGDYIFRSCGDDLFEFRIDGKTLNKSGSFGSVSTSERITITPGVHRLWARVINAQLPPGVTNETTFAMEGVRVDPADNETLEVVTDGDWSIWEDVSTTPGWTYGGVLLNLLGKEQNHPSQPSMLDVIPSFTALVDSDGNDWATTSTMSAKVLSGLEDVLRGWAADGYGHNDAHWEGSNVIVDAWNPGRARPASGLTLTSAGNIGDLTLPTEPAVMTDAVIELNDGGQLTYTEATVAPTPGHPRKRRGFSKGAARTDDQAIRETNAALAFHGRQKSKPTVKLATGSDAPDSALPPTWWKWSTFATAIDSRWSVPAVLDGLAVNFELVDGRFVFTPEFGDLIIPLAARAGITLRRMDPGSLSGSSRTHSRVG